MRTLILVLAVVSLGVPYSRGVVAQTTQPKPQSQIETKKNNQSEAAESALATPSTDRGTARKFYQQGLELMDAGQLSQAEVTLRQALQFDPEYADAYAALGRTYFKLREWQKAIDNLNRAAALNTKQRNANEAALQKRAAEKQKSLDPPRSTEAASNTPKTNPNPNPTKAPTSPFVRPNQQAKTVNIEVKPVQPTNAAATPTPSPKEIKSPAPPPKNAITEQHLDKAPQVKAPKETLQSIPAGTPAASQAANLPVSEQAAIKTRVSQPVTLVPATTEIGSGEIPPVARVEESPLTKVYRVGPNDVLDVRLNDVPGQQSTLYTVTPAGLLEHPLLNEPMLVTGLTVEEIGSRIEDDLRKRAIVETPKALVGVRDYASHSVLVSGLVKDSGTKFLRREAIPLYVVIADAQPLPEAGRVTVIRAEKNQVYGIDLSQAADMNFLVRSGDVVTLHPHATEFVYIGGEIKFPGEKTFRRGLTLMQVILASGGIGPKAKTVEIARNNEKGFLIPTRFNLKELVAGKAVDPVLKPGDRISILR